MKIKTPISQRPGGPKAISYQKLGSRHLLLSGALMLMLIGFLGSCVFSVINMLFLRVITLETALRELQGSSCLAKDTKHNESP